MRYADVTNGTAGTCGANRLHHGFLGTNALQNRIRTDATGQLFDTINSLISTLSHDVCRAELAGELLALFVPAHRDDAFRSYLRTPRRPTAPSPTTATVKPGFTFAASAANQPVPRTSEMVRRLGMVFKSGEM